MISTRSIWVVCFVFIVLIQIGCNKKETSISVNMEDTTFYKEKYRPQLHFSPKEKWMNDPNGMVYHNGEYHLFFQYYPDSTVWGPMHWGHAISKDLVHWENLPIALYPDSLGWIFSGSAVVDVHNTSGFGNDKETPLVAIYTYHSSPVEKAGRTDYQYQGIAYSLDNGRTWIKYQNNPVLPNQGVNDFRDPKVFWYEDTKKWVMTLAVKDHVELWQSPDLKSWKKLSDFGVDYGAHGGVWECPDLFPLPVVGEHKQKWVLLVSINPGGPNGGSATQYFIGNFDGVKFTADYDKAFTEWIDYGPDNYAGVTWSNAPDNRKIFLGWMSNWSYATVVPTERWRSAMTTPRDLVLAPTPQGLKIKSILSSEFINSALEVSKLEHVQVKDSLQLNSENAKNLSQSIISGMTDARDFTIEYKNNKGQKVTLQFDATANQFILNRGRSGTMDFSSQFTHEAKAPRHLKSDKISFTLVADVSSLEVFFDDGLTVMTMIHFPDEPLGEVLIKSHTDIHLENLSIKTMKSVW